jgi:hypothetical protein
VLLNYGNGTFTSQVQYSTGSSPFGVAVGDFNYDSNLDIVTANNGASSVSVLLGYGNGTFNSQLGFAIGNSARDVGVGDFNGDSKLDIVTANFGDATTSVLINAC